MVSFLAVKPGQKTTILQIGSQNIIARKKYKQF